MTASRPRLASELLSRALVDLAEAGTLPPCGSGDEWLSDDPEVRAVAVTGCWPCPIIAECAAAADELRERFGVWAGRDRTVIPRRRRGAAAVPAEGDAA